MKKKMHLVMVALSMIMVNIQKESMAQAKLPVTLSFRDSISAEALSPFLYNTVKLENKSSVTTDLILSIRTPPGWKLLSGADARVKLSAAETKWIPLTLVRQSQATASWLSVVVILKTTNAADSILHRFHITTPAISNFTIAPPAGQLQIKEEQKTITVPVNIRNLGTTPGIYTLLFKNTFLELRQQSTVQLDPGLDSVFSCSIKLPGKPWQGGRQPVLVEVADTAGASYSFTVDLVKMQSVLKNHPSPYTMFPFEVEGGFLQQEKETSYYGAFNGEFKIRDNTLSFFYRSKMYGIINRLEKNVYAVNYKTPHWDILAGQVSDAKSFFVNGRGAKLVYKKNERFQAGLRAAWHTDTSFFTNDNFSGFVQYTLKKIALTHTAAVNTDKKRQLNGYLLRNELILLRTGKLRLSFNAGAGIEQYTNAAVAIKEKPALALGYAFSWQKNKWTLTSMLQQNSINFPGIDKGLEANFHSVKWQHQQYFAEGFYQSNESVSRLFRDTLYNSDILTYNIEKYGVRGGWNNVLNSMTLGTGRLQQRGQTFALLPEYQFLEFTYLLQTKKEWRFQFNSISGYTGNYGLRSDNVFFTTTSGSMALKYGGIKGFYIQTPLFDNTGGKNFLRYSKTLLVGPYVQFTVRKNLKVNVQLNISKSLYDSKISTGTGFTLAYTDRKHGLGINLIGMVPFRYSQAPDNPGLSTRYVNIFLRKRFNLPFLVKRKYHDLVVAPFNDRNNNGKKEADEEGIRNIQVDVNDIPFVTDDKGKIMYRNTDTGRYLIGFHHVKGIKGMIPADGAELTVHLKSGMLAEIPFRKSKVIFGKITVVLDSLNRSNFPPSNIRVTATDTSGRSFSMLTNKAGEFFLNVPAGTYVVSLNPEAFTDRLKPVAMAYTADLTRNDEAVVNFEIRDKKREVRFLNKK